MLDGIDLRDFSAPRTVRNLIQTRCCGLPPVPGVYLVLRRASCDPVFLQKSGAGWFHNLDPSYPEGVPCRNWVPGAQIVYIGMTASQRGLKGRVGQLVDFANGQAVGHRGGRLLWHLADWESLEVVYSETSRDAAGKKESALIQQFRAVYGARPYANMAK